MCADTPYNLDWSPPLTVLVLMRTSFLTSRMLMHSGTCAHKCKAEAWNVSRTMLPASSSVDAWVHQPLTCGVNSTSPHWLPEGQWVKLWLCTKVSLVAALPTCLHYSIQVQVPTSMLPGLLPTGVSKSPKWELKWGKRRLPSEELRGGMDFQQTSELATVETFHAPSRFTC